MRLDLVRGLANDVLDALKFKIDNAANLQPLRPFIGRIYLNEEWLGRCIGTYDQFCDRYRHLNMYVGANELVNETKVAPLQAVAVLWTTPLRLHGRQEQLGLDLALHANYVLAEFVMQEFLELDPKKYSPRLRSRVSNCMGAIVRGEKVRFAEVNDMGVTIEEVPVDHAIDLLIAISEFLVDECQETVPHDQYVQAGRGRESGEGPLAARVR